MFYLINNKYILTLCIFLGIHATVYAENKALQDIEIQISKTSSEIFQLNDIQQKIDLEIHDLNKEINVLSSEIKSIEPQILMFAKEQFIIQQQINIKLLLSMQNINNDIKKTILQYKTKYFIDKNVQMKRIVSALNNLEQKKSISIKNKTTLDDKLKNLQKNYSLRQEFVTTKIKPDAPPKQETHIKLANSKNVIAPIKNLKTEQIILLPNHKILIKATRGESVYAVNNGKVIYSGWLRGYGILVIIDHGDGLMSLYGHNETAIKPRGAKVAKGEIVALVGQSGGQAEAALYFELRKNGAPIAIDEWKNL